jgi:predicted Zn finger-like uncharacterized protein
VNVTCDKCNKRYSIADDKVRGKSVKIRCKQCQNLISVQGPPVAAAGVELGGGAPGISGQWEEERTRAMPAMDTHSQWFAMVKGKQLGPFDLKALEERVKVGELTLRTYLWKQGMADWKRASDVPEVSMVFAGVVSAGAVGSGATATGPTASAPRKAPAVQRDVAVALETPSPEITHKPNGNGHPSEPAAEPAAARAKVPSQSRASAVAKPIVAPAAAEEPAPSAPEPAPAAKAGLNDLFNEEQAGDDDGRATMDSEAAGEESTTGEKATGAKDPFAALGELDPAVGPAPGEATKFFIAQAGVNKRNPPWKIALFVLGGPGLLVGVLFVLSTLHIVPLEVTHTNENGEEVKESFFSAAGVSGLKDMLSGEAKKKKAEAAEKARLAAAAAEVRRNAQRAQNPTAAVANNNNENPGEKAAAPKPVSAELMLAFGNDDNARTKIRVRKGDNEQAAATDSAGLTPEASARVIADKVKAFEGCIEQALRRNPNLAVGPIIVVANVQMSGVVSTSEIEPAKYQNSDWGTCMRDVAKRIVFPKSEGESRIEIPLKVGVAPN